LCGKYNKQLVDKIRFLKGFCQMLKNIKVAFAHDKILMRDELPVLFIDDKLLKKLFHIMISLILF
jgi:hypothetical protein